MIKVAIVKPSGEVASVATPYSDKTLVHGAVQSDGSTLIHIPYTSDNQEVLHRWYYNFETSSWSVRDEKPNEYYMWQDNQWVLDTEKLYAVVRGHRMRLISNCDWTQMPDAPLTPEKQAEWASYRQALRDVPQNNTNITHINEVVWPTPPA